MSSTLRQRYGSDELECSKQPMDRQLSAENDGTKPPPRRFTLTSLFVFDFQRLHDISHHATKQEQREERRRKGQKSRERGE